MFTCSQEIDDVWVVSKFTKNLQFPSEVPVVIFGSVFWEESQELWPLSVMPPQKQLYPLIPITFRYTQPSLGLENVREIKETTLTQGLGCPHFGPMLLVVGGCPVARRMFSCPPPTYPLVSSSPTENVPRSPSVPPGNQITSVWEPLLKPSSIPSVVWLKWNYVHSQTLALQRQTHQGITPKF